MVVLPSDHLICDEAGFRKALRHAVGLAEHGYLVTFGIRPDRPATKYGYIEQGEPLDRGGFRARRFVEKPDLATAERLVASGGHLWNAGIFVWRAERILDEIARFLPRLSAALEKLRRHLATAGWDQALEAAWPQVEAISVDYGVMERASDVAVVPANVGWSDVGDWEAVWEALPKDGAGVVTLGEHTGASTAMTLVWGGAGKPVFTLGVRKLVVVDMPEALLVADLGLAQEVRDLARQAGAPSCSAEEGMAEVRHLNQAQRTVDQRGSCSTGLWVARGGAVRQRGTARLPRSEWTRWRASPVRGRYVPSHVRGARLRGVSGQPRSWRTPSAWRS